jgi:hypothetical protein
VRRALVIVVLLSCSLATGCRASGTERREKLRHDADARVSEISDCRLLTVAWANARDKRTRLQVEERARSNDRKPPRTDALIQAEVEVDAIVARAGQLHCSNIVG